MKYRWSYDTLMRLTDAREWIVFNPRTKKHFEIDEMAYKALFKISTGADETAWVESLSSVHIWDRSENFISNGLLSDPTGMGKKPATSLSGKDAFEALKTARILMTDAGADYLEYLQPLTSILDKNHIGTFHQQIGKFQLTDLRTKEKWKWWHDQKFTTDGKALNQTLYAWVQESFFNKFFTATKLKSKHVLDYGCGNGFYSNKFAEKGATVVGVDTSEDLIALARKNFPKVTFDAPNSVEACYDFLKAQKNESFDLIYISDVLLFFFYDPKTNQTQENELKRLLAEFRRLIRPDGKLYLMEPNGFFWLAGWYGHPSAPYTIVSEARNKLLNVSPRVDQMTQALDQSGFHLKTLHYPPVEDLKSGMDVKAHGFAKGFPIWDFYEAVPVTK